MKRRDFIIQGTAGAVGLGVSGCSSMKNGSISITKSDIRYSDYSFAPTVPKPSPGTMPAAELGTTGIKVSKFGFGSHMRQDIIKNFDDRQRIIREAYDYGVTLFDVYDKEHECYQYEPMGKHLKPMINDVIVSIALLPYDGRSVEEEFEHDLRLFGRDYIDLVRLHAFGPDHQHWGYWDTVFKWKEKGAIRAVGVPVHYLSDLDQVLKTYPIDFVLFPFNYYYNTAWHGHPAAGQSADFEPLPEKLRNKGIGVMTMKAFCGDPLQPSLSSAAKKINKNKDINYNQAALRYVINSPVNPDTTIVGMYNMDHLYLNVEAYYNPAMSDDERELLRNMRGAARLVSKEHLPEHYRFLERWASAESDLEDLKLG